MDKYFSTVRVSGRTVRTVVYADSPLHARLILEFQFGIGSVVGSPTLFNSRHEHYSSLEKVIQELYQNTPQQARIDSLKKQKALITKSLDNEMKRQKIAKAQQQLRMAVTKNTIDL